MLRGDGQHLEAPLRLGGVTEAQAMTVPPGAPGSLTDVLAHMHFCQEEELAHARGENPPPADSEDAMWPPVAPGGWSRLVSDFLAGLAACKRLADARGETPSRVNPDTSVGYDLAGTGV